MKKVLGWSLLGLIVATTPLSAGVTVAFDAPTLNELLPALTLEEVAAGYAEGVELFRQEFGLELGEVIADFETEIVSFDEDTHTAGVLITYVGTYEAFIDDEDDEEDIYWLADDGIWVGGACVAEGFG